MPGLWLLQPGQNSQPGRAGQIRQAACYLVDRAVGLSHWSHHLEVKPLKLTAEHIPLRCSLLELVTQRYAEPQSQSQALEMELGELLEYLRNAQDPALTPLQSILLQTESIGDPAQPGVEQSAVLQWLGEAFNDWEQHYPLEPSLRRELRRLQPLAACLAVTDPTFMVPGAHPLHRIIDSLQLGAVGWQASLGRAGEALQKQIGKAVDAALAWFEDSETDLEAVCSRVVEATERDRARANRMAQRMIETEQGRAKTTEVKRVAAQLINAALEEFQSPDIIGKFLKGPWYDSAQLILLKFGEESAQWTQMSKTTRTLLDSVQFTGEDANLEVEGDAERRQRLFELVSQLPRELKRWLLSVQHDGDALEEAIGMVEYAHMQILRKQPLELENIELIPVPGTGKSEAAKQDLVSMETGQWFHIDLGDDEPKRLKLVLRKEDTGELLFSNLAGIKVLQASFEEIAQLIHDDKVSKLDSGASFSLSLARSAGVTSTEDLGAMLETTQEEAHCIEQEEPGEFEAKELQREWEEARRLQQQDMNVTGQQSPAPQPQTSVLPTGTWVGFHDGEMPLLAKLAVHDRELDRYIFVNRNGIKMRQLNREELQKLIDQSLVDVLDTRSSFRDEIARVKLHSKD
jgi:hypothetical protein